MGFPRRFLSLRTLAAILLPTALLGSAGVLAYLNATDDVEVEAARSTPGIALDQPTTYSLAIEAGFIDYSAAVEQFSQGAQDVVIGSGDTDLAVEWVEAGTSPETELTTSDLVLTVPIDAPVFNLSAEEFQQVVNGEIDNWAEVGGLDEPISLALAAGPIAEPLGLPSDLSGPPEPSSTILEPYGGLSTERRALRVDGKAPGTADYPFRVSAAVVARRPRAEALAPDLAEALRQATPAEPSVRLAAVGDIMLANVIEQNMAAQGVDQPFELVAPYLQQADMTFGNLEGTLTERGSPRPKNYTFRTPPSLAGGLVNAGFDILSVANNHTMDFGPEGLEDTLATLDYLGIKRQGAGANEAEARTPVILEANGLKIGFLSYVNVGQEVRSNYVNETAAADADSPGVAWAYPEDVSADVAALKAQVDLVVVSVHIGIEGSFVLRDWQTDTAHAAIDAGAALVLGHHAHVLQRIEHYGDGVIIFGLGNFVFDVANPGRNNTRSVIAYFELTRAGVVGYDFVPALIDVGENRPRPILDGSGTPILTHILGLTELPPDPTPPEPDSEEPEDETNEEPTPQPTPTGG
jgi:poly-gamma-glutamate capsule biosynthesis protein CapA/YwtB (metallophosphatase superfamily)